MKLWIYSCKLMTLFHIVALILETPHFANGLVVQPDMELIKLQNSTDYHACITVNAHSKNCSMCYRSLSVSIFRLHKGVITFYHTANNHNFDHFQKFELHCLPQTLANSLTKYTPRHFNVYPCSAWVSQRLHCALNFKGSDASFLIFPTALGL